MLKSTDLNTFQEQYPFDTSVYAEALHRELSQHLPHFIAAHKDKGIYAVGVYHSGSWSYIFPSVLTESSLPQFEGELTEEDKEELSTLRWSGCDSDLHEDCEALSLADTESALEALSSVADDYYNNESGANRGNYDMYQARNNAIEEATGKVFQQLWHDGIFKDFDRREQLILTPLCGDQGNVDVYASAQHCNPESALTQLKADAEIEQRSYEKIRAKHLAKIRQR